MIYHNHILTSECNVVKAVPFTPWQTQSCCSNVSCLDISLFHYFSSIIAEGQHRTSVWVDSDTLFLLGDSDFHRFTWRVSVSKCMCVRVCVHACLCIDVLVDVHTIGEEGELRAFCSRHTVDRFFSAWQGRWTERRDDGRVVAWVCQGRWCTSKDDLGGLRMKAEWNFQRTLKGRRQKPAYHMSQCW